MERLFPVGSKITGLTVRIPVQPMNNRLSQLEDEMAQKGWVNKSTPDGVERDGDGKVVAVNMIFTR